MTVCDSLVTCGRLPSSSSFPRLTSCKLLRVSYADPLADWEAVPRMAPRLKVRNFYLSAPILNYSLYF